MTTMLFTKRWVGTMRRPGLAQKLAIAVGILLLFGAHASSALGDGKGLDIGPMVVTVQVDRVKTEHNADWFGPYYHLHYRLSSTGATTAQGSLYAAQGCTNCWTSAYAFADYAYINLSLTDDQGWLGDQPVNINGIYANAQFTVSAKDCTVNTLASLVPVPSTDACKAYTFTSTGSRTSGVDRTATVTGKIIIRTALQHQTAMRRQAYEGYIDVLEGIPLSGQICFDRWKQANADWERELVGLILTGFGLASLPTGTVESLIEYVLGDLGTTIVEYLTRSREYAEAAPTYKFRPPENLWECGNFSTLWVDSNVNGPGGRLRASLIDLRTETGALLDLLRTSSATRATVATNLTGQKDVVNQAAEEAQQLVNVLNYYASTGGYNLCMYAPGCRATARRLLDIVNPISLELQKDSAYIAATLALLTAAPPPPPVTRTLLDLPAFGGIRTGPSLTTLTIYSSGQVVEWALWHGSAYQQGVVLENATANVTIPSNKAFVLEIARPAAGKAGWLFGREGRGQLAYKTLVGGPAATPVVDVAGLGGISKGSSANTLSVYSSGEFVEHQMWHGSTTVQGGVPVGGRADVAVPHYKSFMFTIARPFVGKTAWVFGRENDGLLAVATLSGTSTASTLVDVPGLGGLRRGSNANTLTVYSSGPSVEWALWHGATYQQGTVAGGGTMGVTIPHWKSFVLTIAQPDIGKTAWVFGRENDGKVAYAVLK